MSKTRDSLNEGAIGRRGMTIINNLLCEIIEKTDMYNSTREDYISWLETEIGLTDAEINALDQENLFPMPEESLEK